MFKLATYVDKNQFISSDETSLDKTSDQIQTTSDCLEVLIPESTDINNLNIPTIDTVIPVTYRRSVRKSVPIERYVAEPASGLISKH